ncbi:hypothetical protein MXM41_02565 [Leclercia adecarboxylata]|uniref:hypothetical protein n=1 Tax=Leclercia adecarboxylata TaxID=83655 RepID=UPI002DB8FD96|nr:hypothetical protein [Leclercia adecarboxylata]MEB6377828.1 hypothetical protein [Leclercia adecarboxylata]
MEGLCGEQRMGAELTGGQRGRRQRLRTVFSRQGERGGFDLHMVQDTGPLGQTDQHDNAGNEKQRDGSQLPVFVMSRTDQDSHGQ